MYKLYFIDSKGDKHFVKQHHDLAELSRCRQADMTLRGFKPEPYIRSWLGEYDDMHGQWIDFGSWSCYYFIEGITFEDMCRGDA